jgi:excisionase family DNA binding protein
MAVADKPLAITVEEAARLLRIGRASAYKAAAIGELPTVRVGKRLIVPFDRLLALLNGESSSKTSAPGLPGHEARSTGTTEGECSPPPE